MIAPAKGARIRRLQRHITRLDAQLAQFSQLDGRFFWIRLSVLAVGGVALFLAFTTRTVWVVQATGLAVFLAFVLVVFLHRRLDQARTRFAITRRLAAEAIARMTLDWPALPQPYLPPSSESLAAHPFAPDLNLSGPRSLHHLLDTAASTGGSRRLRSWLLEPTPNPAVALARQQLVTELAARRGFRNGLALNSALVASAPGERWDGEGLLAWLGSWSGKSNLRPVLLVLVALGAISAALFVWQLLTPAPPLYLLTFLAYALIYITRFRDFGELFTNAQHLGATLNRFRAVLGFLESYRYPQTGKGPGSPLAELCAPFWQGQRCPSATLRQVERIASAASLRGNPFVWVALNIAFPWDLFFAYRFQAVRQEMQTLLPVWLDRWYELEALVSLANFTYLNPAYTFPELRPAVQSGEAVFEADSLAHPLIPDEVKVSNSFRFEHIGQIALITGSNMSGKSTFLRTLGINLVLAYAGAPVDAARLRTAPLRLFTCINVSDSLTDGISYFYAEVRRLKVLLNELQRPEAEPLFFLIDEIFRGTNNRERQAGSRAYVEALAGGHGVGCISTHDLELTHLGDEIPAIDNFHFREDVQGDRLTFDYRLRPGPCPTTNALKIMQIEGLPIHPTHTVL